MGKSLDTLTIKGFKSIRELVDFKLTDLNVIIGGNGSGKSNLISFFKMLRALMDDTLNRYVRDSGGAGDILFNGRKVTEKMEFETMFGPRGFRFTLVPTPANGFAIEDEARFYEHGTTGWWKLGDNNEGHSKMVEEVKKEKLNYEYSKPVYEAITSWQIYHFHDTSPSSAMRNYEIVEDNKYLRENADNIAPFLLKLKEKHKKEYNDILEAVRLAIPFFNDFMLEPRKSGSKNEVNISWTQKGSDYPMQPYHFSDGSIRFICLAAALLQPNPPAAIIIDEPELGLHPAAIVILAELIQIASKRTQVIVATQSPALIDQFDIADIIVVKRKGGASTFERLDENEFSEWLENYSIGELWTKNVISGGPVYE
jgi:predicted ATPase